MIQFFASLHKSPNRETYIFTARPASCSLDGRLLWVGKKHFFDAGAARSIFKITQGTAAKGCGDGYNGSLRASQVIARLIKVHACRDKLRISDSELWRSDSEPWNSVSANAVCADPDVSARLALCDPFSQACRSDRTVDTNSIGRRTLPSFISA
jgi:hypothetical protein